MGNLRDRLKRIQEQEKSDSSVSHSVVSVNSAMRSRSTTDNPFFQQHGWASCGFQALKREITIDAVFDVPDTMPQAMMILVPDLEHICKNGKALPSPEDFLFFDLETSGLSGGAGTVAFLAAFGKFVSSKTGLLLQLTQYLLLDYPGENDFLEAALGEFNDKEQIIVSYNGKTFDSQILKTRCLMNRIPPPEYLHADLLHPARRLWKSVLESCSQGTIETEVLGLDRDGDIPGALAPDIWFDFLKTGDGERLMGICDHNCRDIAGLANMLCAFVRIAADPCGEIKQYRYDVEQLALRWRDYVRYSNDMQGDNLRITGTGLLRLAVQKKCPKASFVYAHDLLKDGKFNEGRKRLLAIAASAFQDSIRAAALRALSIDSERRLKNPAEALSFAQQGLELELGETCRNEFERRAERLEKKMKNEE